MADNNKRYKVTGKKPAAKNAAANRKPGKQAFTKDSAAKNFLKQFTPFILFIIALIITISFFVSDFGAVGNFLRD